MTPNDQDPPTQRRIRREPLTIGDRVDNLQESIELLTSMVQKSITAAEQAARSSDTAVVSSRETSRQMGLLANDMSATRKELATLRGKVDAIEKTIGRWPQSPDDTGSGLAGRVAMSSAHSIELRRINESESERPPKALAVLWKKHRKLGGILAIVTTVVVAVVQALIAAYGSKP